MGYDTSFHPVNEPLIRDRVLPYIMGRLGIDDLVATAVEREKVRFRVKAWALGLLKSTTEISNAGRPAKSKKGWLSNLLGSRQSTPRHAAASLPWFDSELHVWGRPFLVVAEGRDEVSRQIDRYLATASADVDQLVAGLLQRVAPGVTVTPDPEGALPSDEVLGKAIRWKIDFFREAYVNLKSGAPVLDPDGNEHDPAELLRSDLPLATLEFAARFTPGWMDRGRTWPTLVLREAGVDAGMFTTSAPLFRALIDAIPDFENSLDSTIVENYRVGGYVVPSRVKDLAASINCHMQELTTYAQKAGWGQSTKVTFQKLREAVDYAVCRGFGFIEATEVYSGPMGIMN